MARPMRPLVRSGGYYPSRRYIPLVYPGGYTTMEGEGGLPSDYKLLEYVGSNGAAYVVTDVFLASTDVIEAEFRNSSTTGYGSLYGVFRLGDSSALYANQTYYGYDESNNKVDTGIRVNTGWHSSRHDFVNGTLTIDDTTVTFPPFEFANTTQNAVLARYYNNSYGYIWKGFIRKFKVTRGGEVICDLLPAKNSDNVAGLYDLVTGNFYTATGGELRTPEAPSLGFGLGMGNPNNGTEEPGEPEEPVDDGETEEPVEPDEPTDGEEPAEPKPESGDT